jgi:3-phosphoglycerate kinase
MDSWNSHVMEDVASLTGKRVIVRLDWNMPLGNDGTISDTSRADVTFPFLKQLSFAGARLVLMTHFGEKGESLQPVASYIRQHMPFVQFVQTLSLAELEKKSHELGEGEAMLLENVRMWPGEEDNLPSLGRSFATLGDVFINNAFSVSHREHASVVGIPKDTLSYFGPLFARELTNLSAALHPEKPALFIIGGAKIKTKLKLIQSYLDKGVKVFVGGAMVHDIWKAKGVEIGESLCDGTTVLSEQLLNHPLLMTPVDVVLENGDTVAFSAIPKNGKVMDCGAQTALMLGKEMASAKTIIANGPLGLYEKGWLKGTEQILSSMAEASASTYIGGGDTVAVAHGLHLLKKFTFVSLGGGAMLEFLASGTLAGIHAVTESKRSGYR